MAASPPLQPLQQAKLVLLGEMVRLPPCCAICFCLTSVGRVLMDVLLLYSRSFLHDAVTIYRERFMPCRVLASHRWSCDLSSRNSLTTRSLPLAQLFSLRHCQTSM